MDDLPKRLNAEGKEHLINIEKINDTTILSMHGPMIGHSAAYLHIT